MKRKLHTFLVIAFLSSTTAFGGGSAIESDVDAILDQQPVLAKFIRSEMEFCHASWYAEIRLANNYPLGGMRLGPYERRARRRGSKGNFDLVLTVNTSIEGYDSDGNEADVTQAAKIVERMTSIDIRYDPCIDDWCKASQPEN